MSNYDWNDHDVKDKIDSTQNKTYFLYVGKNYKYKKKSLSK